MPVSMFTTKIESSNVLREDGGQSERDHDRDDRHQQRDEPGDDGAEDEQEDDQRGRQAELQLALLEVLLREQVEVVVERLIAGDGDVERRVLVGCLDAPRSPPRVVLVRDPERRRSWRAGRRRRARRARVR